MLDVKVIEVSASGEVSTVVVDASGAMKYAAAAAEAAATAEAAAAEAAVEAEAAAASAAEALAASVVLSSDTPASLGVGSPGSSPEGSRSDHVHAMPGKSDIGLSNVLNVEQAPVSHVGSRDLTEGHPLATTALNGFMAATDKKWLTAWSGSFVVADVVGDNVADDTAAIVSAVAVVETNATGGVVFIPDGSCKTTSEILISKSNVYIMGAGKGATVVYPRSATLAGFVFGDGSVVLQRNGMIGLTIYNQVTDPTASAMVRLIRCNQFYMANAECAAGYIGLDLQSVVHSHFIGCNFTGDANLTALAVGSAAVKISTYSGGAVCSELHFVGCDYRGQTANHYLDNAVLITECDGVFFDGHIGMARYGIHLKPASNSSVLYSVTTTELYLDNCSLYGLFFEENGTGYTGNCGFHKFGLSTVHLCGTGIGWAGSSNFKTHISGGIFQNIGTHGINLYKGSNVAVHNCSMMALNTTGTTGGGVLIGALMSKVQVLGLEVQQGFGSYAPTFGVRLVNGASGVHLDGLTLRDCTNDILDETTSTDKRFGPWKTSAGFPAVASAETTNFPPNGMFTITGTTWITEIGGTAWQGRVVTFITISGAVTFTAGATIAKTVTTTANKPATAVYAGTKWYITA